MNVTKMVEFLEESEMGNILYAESGGGLEIYVQEVYLPEVDTTVYGVYANNNTYYDFFTTYEEAYKLAHEEATNRFCIYRY